MKKLIFVSMGLLCIAFLAFRYTESTGCWTKPKHFPEPGYDFTRNPMTPAKIQLGRALFYDPILSRNNTISCASCHSPFSAFTHVDHALSHGIDDRMGLRNSPALMNLAWQRSFMRDGAVNHLDMQALAPLSNSAEMDETITHVVSKLQSSPIYPSLFYQAFGDSTVTGEHLLKSLAQFMLTLISSNAKYDRVVRNESVFTEQENRGYQLYKKNCAECHKEPLFTNDAFMNNGLPIDTALNDYGRMRVTKNTSDSLKFKVPTLRNLVFSYPYMHDGRFRKLSEVLQHYTSGIVSSPTLSASLKKPIILSSKEKVDLQSFLLTLSDTAFVFNPAFAYPKEILLK